MGFILQGLKKYNLIFTQSGFKQLLDSFADLAKEKNHKETSVFQFLPYDKWRTLVRMSKLHLINIYIFTNEHGEIVEFKIESEDNVVSCSPHDNSFGSFLSSEVNLLDKAFNYTVQSLGITPTPSTMIIDNNNITTPYCTTIKSSGDYYSTIATTIDRNCYPTDSFIEEKIEKYLDERKKTEMSNTSNSIFSFDFGPIHGNKLRLSTYGYAIPNKEGKYVSYDPNTERMVDVQILNFDCANLFFKMPKAISKVDIGDVVFHNNVPMFITDIVDNTRFIAVDPYEGTEKTILPAHSMFGFDYLTCLVSLVDGFSIEPSQDNPFGNMLPLILMGNSQDKDSLLPLLLLNNGEMDMENPFMLMALSGNNCFDTSNPLTFMAMMKLFNK